MSRPIAALLAAVVALGLVSPAQAQGGERFTDADFEFSITLPAGMRELSFDERVETLGMQGTPDAVRNVPRAEAVEGGWTHNHVWVEQGGAERFVHITILDSIPFSSPQEFIEAMGQATPVLENGTVAPEEGGPAVWVERRFEGALGVPKRLRVYYYVDPGNGRSMSMKLQAREDAWEQAEPDLLAMLDTLDWERRPADVPMQAGAGMPMGSAAPAAAGRGGGGRQRPADAGLGRLPSVAQPEDYASWGSLEVVGSLILAGLLLMGLLFGGRGG